MNVRSACETTLKTLRMQSDPCLNPDSSVNVNGINDKCIPGNGERVETRGIADDLLYDSLGLGIEENDKRQLDDGDRVKTEGNSGNLLYTIQETPPFGVLVSNALQHLLLGLGGALSTAYVIADVICADVDHPIRAKLFCTSLFMTGVCTILQSCIGVRLPIFQGVCSTFLIPLVAMKSFKDWNCEEHRGEDIGYPLNEEVTTSTVLENMTDMRVFKDQEMYRKLQEMSGCLILSSLLEVFVGMTGLVGIMLRFIGPLTVATVISLIGLSLYKIPLEYARTHWGIAAVCIVLSIVFMLYMNRVRVPMIVGCKKSSAHTMKLPVFGMFPILISIAVTWLICGILTAAGALTDDEDTLQYQARTDVRLGVIHNTPWFYVPYPGQFGSPLFNTTIFIGFSAAVISSILESIGDYYAAADLSEVPPPPSHAVNRGILLEGLGSVLSGAMGAGHATTSSTTNVALIGIGQVASRSCLVFCGFMCLIFSVVGKFGAVLAMMPAPIVGGAMFVIFGILGSIGMFSLRAVDMRSSRNIAIFGISLYAGIGIPEWVERYPEIIDTGNMTTDGVIRGILGSPMLLGCFVAALLDNTVKGTKEERGFVHRQNTNVSGTRLKQDLRVYNIPFLNCKTFGCLRILPFLPKPEYHCAEGEIAV